MTDHDDPQHRAYHHPDPERITLREDVGDSDDGSFVVRMPVASTGDVRNEGDEPLSRDALEGMGRQINSGRVGVFLDHGASSLGGGGGMFGNRYSAVGKVGMWENAEVVATQDDDGPALLEADARFMDPETLPAAAGSVREALAVVKSQVERDIPLSSSIGWREDDDFPGGNDLMEASIVGIPADPRTMSQDAVVDLARRMQNANPDASPEALVDEFRAVVMGPDTEREEMTEDSDSSGEQSEDTTSDDGESEQRDAPEWAQELLEKQEEQTGLLQSIEDAVRQDDEDDDDDDDGTEENEGDHDDEDDDEDEQSADVDNTQDTTEDDAERGLEVDGETLTADDIRELREQIEDSAPEQPDSEQASEDRDADTPGDARDNDDDDDEDGAKALLRGN